MDKRVLKTRAAIFNAAVDLYTEKEVPSKITVLELCQRAGINKSTFYLHYKSMEDCLGCCLNSVLEKCVDYSKSIDYSSLYSNAQNIVSEILDQVEENLLYLEKIKNANDNGYAMNSFKSSVIEVICDTNDITIENDYKKYVTVTYLVGGLYDSVFASVSDFDKDALKEVLVNMIQKVVQ
jgi:AcrR family transcriptional regulator